MSYKDTGITFKTSTGKKALSLQRAIDEIAGEIVEGAHTALTEALDDTGLWAAGELRKEAMAHGWTHYYKGFTYERTGKKGNTVKVYNESHYQLTHLLEKGHRIVTHDGRDTGKKTAPQPHFAPVNDQIPDKIDTFYEQRLKEEGL